MVLLFAMPVYVFRTGAFGESAISTAILTGCDGMPLYGMT
jgi:hypothetical protein